MQTWCWRSLDNPSIWWYQNNHLVELWLTPIHCASLITGHHINQWLRDGRGSPGMSFTRRACTRSKSRQRWDSMWQLVYIPLALKVLCSIYMCRSSSTCTGAQTTNSKVCTSYGSAHFWRWKKNGRCSIPIQVRFITTFSLTISPTMF